MISFFNRVFSPRINLFLYSFLLLLTPFLMLQSYLQDAIGMFSEWSFYIAGIKLPFLAIAFVLLMVTLIIRFRKSLTRTRLSAWFVIVLMWLLSHHISDYYLDTPLYHLQHNWHYIAYGLFAFLAFQAYSVKFSNPAKVIRTIFFMAMLISSFDEFVQVFISSRIFDISDVAKDLWGTLMGILYLYFIYQDPSAILSKGWSIRAKNLKEYRDKPIALIFWLILFTFILQNVSASLTEPKYTGTVVFITLLIFLPVFLVVHLTRAKSEKIFFSVVGGILILLLATSFVNHYNKGVEYRKNGIILYKGIPLPYFDVMIFENGGFRFVDKKTFFNLADKNLLYKKSSDILLIGSGEKPIPRMGFPEDMESQFVFNHKKNKGLQVIILPTDQACKVFNRLKKEKKKVVFVIHQD